MKRVHFLLGAALLLTGVSGCVDGEPTEPTINESDPSSEEAEENQTSSPPIALRVDPSARTLILDANATVPFQIECSASTDEDLRGVFRHVAPNSTPTRNETQTFEESKTYVASQAIRFQTPGMHTVQAWCELGQTKSASPVEWIIDVDAPPSPQMNQTNESSRAHGNESLPNSNTTRNSTTEEEDRLWSEDRPEVQPPEGDLEIRYLADTGGGDPQALLAFPDATVVIDAGCPDCVATGLDETHRTEIDYLLLPSPTRRHVHKCDELFVGQAIETVIHPEFRNVGPEWARCMDALEQEGSTNITGDEIDPGDYLQLSEYATIQVLNLNASKNMAGSLAFRLTYGNFSMVFASDMACQEENQILDQDYNVSADVLEVSRHGSQYGTCGAWIDAVSPRWGIITRGHIQEGEQPHETTLNRLDSRDVEITHIPDSGTLKIKTDGQTVIFGDSRAQDA